MNIEQAIKDASLDLLLHVKEETGADVREIADFSTKIQDAFTYSLLSDDPNALEELKARTTALLELTRIKVVQEKKEVIRSSIMLAARITSTLIKAL